MPRATPPPQTNTDRPSQTHQTELIEPSYTAFSRSQQRITIMLVAFATLASPLIAILYLPLLPLLALQYGVSVQAINLTITAYIIAQAIAPLLLSTHSDTFGRRPIYLLSFALATVASLGIALNNTSYNVLIALRVVQSLGASAVLSVGYGVVADLRPSSTRGKLLGTMLAFSNLGTAVGPLVGGIIAYTDGDVRWAFWTMFIFCGSLLVALALFLPETARQVVGRGDVQDRTWNRSIYSLWTEPTQVSSTPSNTTNPQQPHRELAFRSPVRSIFLMRFPDSALILWIVGSFYALWYTVQASIPLVFTAVPYQFNELQIGLCYLPGAAGVIISMYTTGRIMDHNYKVLERRQERSTLPLESQEKHAQNQSQEHPTCQPFSIADFPIERARSRFCPWVLVASLGVSVGYGWSIHGELHAAVLLTLQLCMGFLSTWMLNVFNALLVDIFPEAPSTAATAGNLVRCGFGAAAVAVLEPLTRATSRGWFFTMMGLASAAFGFAAVGLLNKYGMRWRQKRIEGEGTGG